MAVAYDAGSAAAATTGTITINHVPVGTPRGIVVVVVQNVGATNEITGVTYGGVAMSAVASSPVLHSTGETGAVYGYFLGSSIPTGNQTASVTVNGTASTKVGGCFSVTAATDTAVQTTNTVNNDSVANPAATLSLSGESCWCALVGLSGQGAVAGTTPFTNWTSLAEADFGNQIGLVYRYNIVGTTDVSAGWTQTAEDAVMLAMAIKESAGAPAVVKSLAALGVG